MKTLNTKKKPEAGILGLEFNSITWEGAPLQFLIVDDIGVGQSTWSNGTINIEPQKPEHRDCPECRTVMNYMLITSPSAVQEEWNECESCGYREKI